MEDARALGFVERKLQVRGKEASLRVMEHSEGFRGKLEWIPSM